MFGKRVTLMKVFGIEIKLDISWLIVFALMTWSLSRGVFPFQYGKLPQQAYWLMGLATVVGLFASIIIHELCHSLVARHYRIPIRSITLFIFGGAAEIEDEPPSPKAEFLMAIAGPAFSIFAGLILGQAAGLGKLAGWPVPVTSVLGYLASLNIILAIFNLLPAFPLDGGRMLRAVLWRIKRDLRWATHIASEMGAGLGLLLILLGFYRLFRSDFIGGLWYIMIGMFLRGAAEQSYLDLLIRRAFAGQTVRRFMKTDTVTVPSGLPIRSLVEDYFYRYHFKVFPVVDGRHVLGCVSLLQVKEIPQADWARITVGQIAKPCSPENTISPDADLRQAMSAMNRAQASTLVVVEAERVVGTLSLRDIMGFLTVKLELEGASAPDKTPWPALHDGHGAEHAAA